MAANKKAAPKVSKTAKKMTKKHSVAKRVVATKQSGTPKVSKAALKKTTAKTVKRVAKKPAAKKAVVAKKKVATTTLKKAASKQVVSKQKPAAKKAPKKVSVSKQKAVAKKVMPKKAEKKPRVAKKASVAKKPRVAKKATVAKKAPVVKTPVSKKVAPKKRSASKKSAPTRTSISKSAPSMVDLAKGNAARKAASRAKIEARKAPILIPKSTAKRKKISKSQAKTYEATLLRIRDELSRQIAYLRGASLTRDDEVNAAEDGSDAFERQLALKLAANENDAVFEIDEALDRIKNGDYAICEDCGCIISRARLQALPFARRCVSCKSVSEKTGGYQQRRFL